MAAQRGDIILVDGEQMELFSNPLEDYWLVKRKKRPNFFKLDSCVRGYIATWKISDNELFLVAVEGDVEKSSLFFSKRNQKYSLANLFPKSSEKGVMAFWFTGKLRVPRGNMTQYEDTGYDSRFEKEMIITVERGKVLKKRILDYTQKTLIVSN